MTRFSETILSAGISSRIIAPTMLALIIAAILGLSVSQARAAASQPHSRDMAADASDVPVMTQEGGSRASQIQPTPMGTAYPAPTISVRPTDLAEPLPDAYPAAPPTPIVFPTDSYPTISEPDDVIDGGDFPNIGSLNTGPTGEVPGEEHVTQTEPILGTLFLWLGFGAAFAVFVSSIVGAIYYYDRQRAGSK